MTALCGRVVVACGRHYRVELEDGRTLDAFPATRRGTFACGDVVELEPAGDGRGIIVSMRPRTSLLMRSDGARDKPIAANAGQVIVVAATEPGFSDELISRALVAAEHQGLDTLIVLNKIDLAGRLAEARAKFAPFAAAGYRVIELCALRSIAPLRASLAGRLSVLVGPSGSGKSTLINALVPGAAARTNAISQALDSGRHTTTMARLYPIDARSAVIDSPGMQWFGIAHIPDESLAGLFPELRTYAGRCRFRDCRHDREPGCAVREALESGALSHARHAHFLKLRAR